MIFVCYVLQGMDRQRTRKSVDSHKFMPNDKNLGGLDSIENASFVKVTKE